MAGDGPCRRGINGERDRYTPERVRQREADERSEKVSGLRGRDSGEEGQVQSIHTSLHLRS